MSSSANVRSIAVLEELKAALMRFKSDARGSLETADAEINRARAWLQERLAYWQSELKRRRRQLEEAETALAGCLMLAAASAGYADCSPLEAAVMRAKRRVEEAEQELRIVQQYIKMIEEAIVSYQRQARQLVQVLDNDLLKGAQLLSNSVAILESYMSESLGTFSPITGSDISLAFISAGSLGIPAQGTSPATGLPTTDGVTETNPESGPNRGPGGSPNRSGSETESSEGSPGERKERYEGPSHAGPESM